LEGGRLVGVDKPQDHLTQPDTGADQHVNKLKIEINLRPAARP
jgi:hypothetical protein